MSWPPRQPKRSEMPEDKVFFWDAVVDRARIFDGPDVDPVPTAKVRAMKRDLAVGPNKALSTAALDSEWDGVEREDSDPEVFAQPFGLLLQSPEMAWHVASLSALLRENGDREDSYSHADREFINQVGYADFGISYWLTYHIGSGIAQGVRPEAIEALWEGREWDLTEDERLLADFIRRVMSRTMTRETWEAMERRLGESGTVDYAFCIALHLLIATLTRALNYNPEVTSRQAYKLVQAYKDGKQPPPLSFHQPYGWLEKWGVRALLRNAQMTKS